MQCMRTLEWDPKNNQLRMIDQRLLPQRLEYAAYTTYPEVARAIQEMVVRGAPAIGVAGAYGMALAAMSIQSHDRETFLSELDQAAEVLRQARPTAVNLAWAIDQLLQIAREIPGGIDEIRATLLDKAHQMADEDVAINQRMARYGAELIQNGDTIIHHCNTGALATVDWGTALGVIRMAHEQGKQIHVLVDETRPRLQGARLTAWELAQYGIPFDIISDNAAGYFLSSGQVQKVMFGADRVAANGDVANKIGTYMLALAAFDNEVPVYAVFPKSTVDFKLPSGKVIPIEERSPDEVLNIQIQGETIVPSGSTARNPAFDVTPHRILTACVTECGIIYPPFYLNLARILKT